MKYIFRGNVVVEYDPDTKQVTAPLQDGNIANFDYCRFIPEDYKLLAEFFERAYKHATGEGTILDLIDVDVN